MGEVYRARDVKLGREVAIKVLPHAFTSDPGRLARFDREARTLAALNHPNICAIHGFEHAGDIRFLVLELVGRRHARRTRLAGVALRTRRAVPGLPAARRPAHRATDRARARLRPRTRHRPSRSEAGEHQVTPDGAVKVLDFGLAKATAGDAAGADLEAGAERHAQRHDRRRAPRHAGLHEPRAGARQAGRQAHRHLGVRLRAVRNADRARRVCTATRSPTRSRKSSSASLTGPRCRDPRQNRFDSFCSPVWSRIHSNGCRISATSRSTAFCRVRRVERRWRPQCDGVNAAAVAG